METHIVTINSDILVEESYQEVINAIRINDSIELTQIEIDVNDRGHEQSRRRRKTLIKTAHIVSITDTKLL